jgi:hypothetical protein
MGGPMSNLTPLEKARFEKIFEMSGGYVLDFSNRRFQDFILDNMGIDIYSSKYDYESGSKANRLRSFWKLENNQMVGKLNLQLLEYWKFIRECNNIEITGQEYGLFNDCINICERLLQNKQYVSSLQKEFDDQKKIEREASKDNQLSLLLKMFDELAQSKEPQKRGFLLQDLLNKVFEIYDIAVRMSFQRNSGGEQIDGAFSMQGWYYLVECKWTKKLADVSELDSLLGKVNRSGRQSMGLFLSIEGWSEKVPMLLKQNPDKCIILMDGYDLRCVLSGAVDLEELLTKKISKLNLDSEPFFSVVELLI